MDEVRRRMRENDEGGGRWMREGGREMDERGREMDEGEKKWMREGGR